MRWYDVTYANVQETIRHCCPHTTPQETTSTLYFMETDNKTLLPPLPPPHKRQLAQYFMDTDKKTLLTPPPQKRPGDKTHMWRSVHAEH